MKQCRPPRCPGRGLVGRNVGAVTCADMVVECGVGPGGSRPRRSIGGEELDEIEGDDEEPDAKGYI